MTAKVDYQRLKVLVIEDQSFIRSIVVKLIRSLGAKDVFEATDGSTGLRACQQHNPDIIVCDIEMEPMDGLEFLRALRSGAGMAHAKAPVVFLTSHAESDTVQKARDAGVTAFLVKPVSQKGLQERLDWVVAKHYPGFVSED